MDEAISLLCSACAAVGCALPSSHPNVPDCRLSAACAPLRAACCRRVASEQRRMPFLCSACAAGGYALVSLHPNAEEHVDDLAALARKKGCSQKPRKRKEFGRVIVFFYRPTCSYRFMFFFIEWKLPPPACPGTTGIRRFCSFLTWIRRQNTNGWNLKSTPKGKIEASTPNLKKLASKS